MKVAVTFRGRLNNAIGSFYTITEHLIFDTAPTEKDVLTELYKKYEHVRIQSYHADCPL